MLAHIIPISLNNGFTNVYLIKDKKNMLIDTGMKNNADEILKKLIEHGVTPCSLHLIVLTHNHPDHSGGLARIKKVTNAKVFVHKSEANKLKKGECELAAPNSFIMKLFSGLTGDSTVPPVQPDILLDNYLDLNPYGVSAYVTHTPGHTIGSVSIVLSDGSVFVGDCFNAKPNKVEPPYFCNDKELLKKSIKKLIEIKEATCFYTSHGKTCDKIGLQKFMEKM